MNAITPIDAGASVSHIIKTSLGHLHVLETGFGPKTIVLWPSIFTDHRIYHDIVGHLGTAYRFLLIDGPAHGKSEGSTEEFTMDACADAMAQIMDSFGLDKAIVGGTSWGGITAAHLALNSPGKVEALILMNTPMEIDSHHPGIKARFIAGGARWMLRTAIFRNGVANSFFTPEVLAANPTYAQAFHEMLRAANPLHLSTAIRSVILRASPLLPRMADLTVPTLIVAGKEDAMYPIAVQAEAALLAPKGRFAPVAGKHISVVERPQEVAATISDFLGKELVQ